MNKKNCLKAAGCILQLVIYAVLLPVFGICLYKSNSRAAQRFYHAMCGNMMFRLLYMLTFATGIAAVNTLYTWTTHDFTCASLTLAVSLPLLFERLGHPLLSAIRGCRQMMLFLLLVALAALLTAHMLTFAASIYYLLVAAVFYPSRRAVEEFQRPGGLQRYRQCPDTLAEVYFG